MGLRTVAGLAACALFAAAQRTFTIDASAPIGTPLNVPLLDCVGSGHSALALRADYQEHLARAQRDIGFKHIRGHGLLGERGGGRMTLPLQGVKMTRPRFQTTT